MGGAGEALTCGLRQVRRAGGGRGSLWRLQTSERLARLGAACAGAADARACAPQLRVQLRAAAARLEAEARALASPAPHSHHLADGVERALRDLADIVHRCRWTFPPLDLTTPVSLQHLFIYSSFLNKTTPASAIYSKCHVGLYKCT